MKTRTSTTVLAGLLALILSSTGVTRAAESTPNDAGQAGQAVELSPFEVSADSDTSYGALNSNSITRFNTALSELPVSADIFSETFMADVDATSIEDVVANYSAGGGYTTAGPEGDAANMQEGDRQATSSVTIRGLMSPTLRRDGFIQLGSLTNPGSTGSGFSSTFDIERVEVINGPQSLLYGSGGGGGVLNTISKRARFDKRPFGSVKLKIDNYGYFDAQFDYGFGTDKFAVRVAALKGEVGSYRDNIGAPLTGYYLQFAAKVKNTILRLSGGMTDYPRLYNAGLNLTARNSGDDGRHNRPLKLLLATNQLEQSATGNSGAGSIADILTWENADSFGGWHRQEYSKNSYAILTAESRWTNWLTTEISAGYNDFDNQLQTGGGGFFAPNATANPTGVWASRANGATIWKPTRTSAFRFAAVAEHSLFGASSKTMFGIDYSDSEQPSINMNLYEADANWNIIGTDNSRRAMPFQYYSIENGPVKKPLHYPFSDRVTVDGINYLRAPVNPADPARVSAENPLGVIIGGSVHQYSFLKATGIYLVNQAQWMEKRLTTLSGVRYNDSKAGREWSSPAGTLSTPSRELDFNFGANYKLRDWIHPYVGVSSSFNPPLEQGIGPDGIQVETSHALGYEGGVKIQNRTATLSGSMAYYYLDSKDENQRIPGDYINIINPSGINGRNGAASTWANVSRRSEGVQISVTYDPTPNWRMRLAAAWIDGTIGTSHTYKQFYNDEFHTNSAGQVTYGDGTVLYVPATPSATDPVVLPGTPGAMPLTVAMMNDPQSEYYADPVPVSAAISPNSAVARVLRFADFALGTAATGRVGLPISEMQINPGFTPPGEVATSHAGEFTTGYPTYSINYTTMYTFREGMLDGVRIGGTWRWGSERRGFYYYPTNVQDGAREMFFLPDIMNFDAVVGYSRSFRRFGWSTQLNVTNMFNNYDVLLLPNPVTGWSGIGKATFSASPRSYTLSTTFSF